MLGHFNNYVILSHTDSNETYYNTSGIDKFTTSFERQDNLRFGCHEKNTVFSQSRKPTYAKKQFMIHDEHICKNCID